MGCILTAPACAPSYIYVCVRLYISPVGRGGGGGGGSSSGDGGGGLVYI